MQNLLRVNAYLWMDFAFCLSFCHVFACGMAIVLVLLLNL